MLGGAGCNGVVEGFVNVLKLRAMALGLVALVAASACAGTPAPSPTAAQQTAAPLVGGTVTVRLRGAVGPLEITAKQMNATANFVSTALYDTLIALDPDTAEPLPYLAKSWTQTPTSVTFTVKVRPEWKWGPQNRTAQTSGFPEKIVYKSIDNDTTAANLLLTGGLDIADVAGPDISRLVAESSLGHRTQSNAVASPLLFNMQPGKTAADEAVREAIMTALDRDAYNKAAFSGLGKVPGAGFLVKGVRCYDDTLASLIPAPSVAKAKQVLTAAGYVEAGGKFSKSGKPLTLSVLGQVSTKSGVEYIAATLDSVGFTTSQQVVDTATYSTLVRPLSWDVVQLSIGGQTPTFGSYMPFLAGGKMVTDGGVNRAGIFDPVVDSSFASYLSATSPADACKFMSAFQRRILEKHYVLPIVAGTIEYFGKNFAPYMTAAWQIVRTKAP